MSLTLGEANEVNMTATKTLKTQAGDVPLESFVTASPSTALELLLKPDSYYQVVKLLPVSVREEIGALLANLGNTINREVTPPAVRIDISENELGFIGETWLQGAPLKSFQCERTRLPTMFGMLVAALIDEAAEVGDAAEDERRAKIYAGWGAAFGPVVIHAKTRAAELRNELPGQSGPTFEEPDARCDQSEDSCR